MSLIDPKRPTAPQRLDRLFRRERLRAFLNIGGIALLVAGLLIAAGPFGASISNPVVVPKADPHAGIALLQSLQSGPTGRIGLLVALAGVVLLATSALLRTDKAQARGSHKG